MQIRWSVVPLAIAILTLAAPGSAQAQFAVRSPLAPAEDFHVELGVMFWSPTPQLIIGSEALSGVGIENVDFVDEFDIDNERFTEFRVVAKAGRKHKVRFSYVPVRYDEQATLARTITFHGQTFPINVEATAEIDWKLWRFGYEWDFVTASAGFIGLVAELKYNKVTAEVSSDNPAAFGDVDVTAPVPTLGVIARGYVHRHVSVTAEFTGLKLPQSIRDRFKGDNEEFDIDFSDFDIYATGNLGRHFAVQGGFRRIAADYLIDNDSGDLELKGVYLGGLVRF